MLDKNNTFIIAPSPKNRIGEILAQWIQRIGVETIDKFTLDDALMNKNDSLFMCLGDESLNQIVERFKQHPFPSNKVFYHIGSAKNYEYSMLNALGVKGILGYREETALLTNPEDEPLFREAFFAGFYSLMQQESLGVAYRKSKQAWEKLINLDNHSKHNLTRHYISLELLNNNILYGDENWFMPNPSVPHLIHYDRNIPQLIGEERNIFRYEQPIIEVVDFSPVFLKWLEEDPKRIASLSPDKFEDLVADRLAKAGLNVEKTGTTNTPDGGIDIIASPRYSSFPFVLAAQIKHSRVNRKVSANVVRDFRGAITSLPIDIGMIVTNTEFTASAEWTARQLPKLIRLRNFEDIKLWLSDKIDESVVTRDFPESIEVAPGLIIPIPRSIK